MARCINAPWRCSCSGRRAPLLQVASVCVACMSRSRCCVVCVCGALCSHCQVAMLFVFRLTCLFAWWPPRGDGPSSGVPRVPFPCGSTSRRRRGCISNWTRYRLSRRDRGCTSRRRTACSTAPLEVNAYAGRSCISPRDVAFQLTVLEVGEHLVQVPNRESPLRRCYGQGRSGLGESVGQRPLRNGLWRNCARCRESGGGDQTVPVWSPFRTREQRRLGRRASSTSMSFTMWGWLGNVT